MTVRVGIVGWGEIARQHARALTISGARVRGDVSRSGAAPDGATCFESLDAMLPHVDAVTIAVPNHLHAAHCLTAVQAGVPVLVEKPLITSAAQLAELEPALLSADSPVHVGFRLRWNPQLLRFRAALQPALSQDVEISCSYELGIDALADGKDWTRQLVQTGGTFFTLGVHMLDLARWLARLEGESLSDMEASADGSAENVDYPLRMRVTGMSPGGARIVAVADTRERLPYCIQISARGPNDAILEQLQLDASSEKAEYEAMLRDFVEATVSHRIDLTNTREILQVHRELLYARALAPDDHASPPDSPRAGARETDARDH